MANITATCVVNFGDGAGSGILTAEIDSRPDGFNQGKTSFTVGDEPVILVRKSSNVTINQVIATSGSCGVFSSGSTAEKEFLTYVQTKVATSSKPISSGFSSQWYGTSLGGVVVKKSNEVTLTDPNPITGAGVLGITYNSAFIAYKLSGVPATLNGESTFDVLIAFIGTAV